MVLDDLTEIAKEVHTVLGVGLTEAIYRNALAIGLRKRGYVKSSCEVSVPIFYEAEIVGMIRADIVIEVADTVHIIELKSVPKITEAHVIQANSYSRHFHKRSQSYVVNFGKEVEVRCVHK